MARETANNGWICLQRAMRNWQWYDDAIIKSIFIDLLFSACTEPTWFKGRKLGRGQSAISVDTLAQNTGLSKPTVIKALRQLEESGEIVRTKWKFYVITTIRNYSKYQANMIPRGFYPPKMRYGASMMPYAPNMPRYMVPNPMIQR